MKTKPIRNRLRLSFLILFICSFCFSGLSQDINYARKVLKDLCAPEMYGRAYVNHGDRIAADYIAAEFSKWKVKPFDIGFLQPFTMRINGMPKADVKFNDKNLRPGIDYLVEAQSPSLSGTYPVFYADTRALRNPGKFMREINQNRKSFILLDSVGLNNPTLYQFAKSMIQSELLNPRGVIEIVHRVPFGIVRKHFDEYVRIQLEEGALKDSLKEISVDIVNEYYPEYPTQNIIGYVEGKTNEWVVFTGHYDGEGMYGNALFPAANDNASGTVMVMDLARHFASGKKPNYNVAFMLVAGEEAGLLGSRHYVNNPLFPLEKIRMVINLDMVGSGSEGCRLFNATQWPAETGKIQSLNKEMNPNWEIQPVGPAANSDHHPFHLKGVPAIFFLTVGKAGPAHTAIDTYEALPFDAYDHLFKLITRFIDDLPSIPKLHSYPLTDYHVHLKGDFTYQKAIERSKITGIQYGVALNCGLGFQVDTDEEALSWLEGMKGSPFKLAMQAEGREWVDMFSKKVINQFDYVFTDAMTYTNENGKRVRLWINDEVEIKDPQKFMDGLVSRIVKIIETEPIDIYVNPTFLPDCIADQYDQLWTNERMLKVIDAAMKSKVAIEINNRYRIPSQEFISLAKSKGVKFAFGTNNADSNMGDLNYCRDIVIKCGLTDDDMWKLK